MRSGTDECDLYRMCSHVQRWLDECEEELYIVWAHNQNKSTFRITIGKNKDMVNIRELQEKLKDIVTITLRGNNKHCILGHSSFSFVSSVSQTIATIL